MSKTEEYRKGWNDCQGVLFKRFNDQLAAGKNLRDEFAMAAMQGAIAEGALQRIAAEVARESDSLGEAAVASLTNQLLASMTYQIADAMLEARKAS